MVGFNNMTWVPPEKVEAEPGTYVSEAGLVEVAPDGSLTILRDATDADFEQYPILIIGETVPQPSGRGRFPWWLLVVAAGIAYAEMR